MKRKIHHDVFVALILATIAGLGYLRTLIMPKGADRFPQILFTLFAIFAVMIFIKGIRESKIMTQEGRSDVISLEGLKLPFAALAIVTVYTILAKYLGFFVSTAIYIPAFMIFYRYKKVPYMIVSIIGTLIFVYLVFVKQLNVPFPTGLLF